MDGAASLALGQYQRLPEGRWRVATPTGEVVTLCPRRTPVVEHEDGTLSTVVRTLDWTWRLERGVWS